MRRGRNQGATGWADIAGPEGRAEEWSPSAHAAVRLDEPEPSERTAQWRCHAQDCNGAAVARIARPCGSGWWACQDLNLGPHPYQRSAPGRVSPRWHLRLGRLTDRWRPLRTARIRWDVDQMWTRRPARWAAALRLADLSELGDDHRHPFQSPQVGVEPVGLGALQQGLLDRGQLGGRQPGSGPGGGPGCARRPRRLAGSGALAVSLRDVTRDAGSASALVRRS